MRCLKTFFSRAWCRCVTDGGFFEAKVGWFWAFCIRSLVLGLSGKLCCFFGGGTILGCFFNVAGWIMPPATSYWVQSGERCHLLCTWFVLGRLQLEQWLEERADTQQQLAATQRQLAEITAQLATSVEQLRQGFGFALKGVFWICVCFWFWQLFLQLFADSIQAFFSILHSIPRNYKCLWILQKMVQLSNSFSPIMLYFYQ